MSLLLFLLDLLGRSGDVETRALFLELNLEIVLSPSLLRRELFLLFCDRLVGQDKRRGGLEDGLRFLPAGFSVFRDNSSEDGDEDDEDMVVVVEEEMREL